MISLRSPVPLAHWAEGGLEHGHRGLGGEGRSLLADASLAQGLRERGGQGGEFEQFPLLHGGPLVAVLREELERRPLEPFSRARLPSHHAPIVPDDTS